MAFQKDRAIIAQNSATVAATLIAGVGGSYDSVEHLLSEFEAVRTAVFNGSLELAGGEPTESAPRQSSGGGFRPRSSSGGGDYPNDHGAGVKFKSGKHQGSSISEVYESGDEGREYIEWFAASGRNDFMRTKCADFLTTV